MQNRAQRPTTSSSRKPMRGTSAKRNPQAAQQRPISANTQLARTQTQPASQTIDQHTKPNPGSQKHGKVPSLVKSANRFRIAQPGMTTPDISGRYWNQVSTQIQYPTGDFQQYVKEKMKGLKSGESRQAFHQQSHTPGATGIRATLSQSHLQRETPIVGGERNLFRSDGDDISEIGLQEYRHGALLSARGNEEDLQRPFTFLSSLGGKDTSSALITPKIAMGPETQAVTTVTLPPRAPSAYTMKNMKQTFEEPNTKMTIFTDANVDQHEFDIREKRLQSAKTRIGQTRPLSSNRSQKTLQTKDGANKSRPPSNYQPNLGQSSSRAQKDFRIQSGRNRPQSAMQKNKILQGYSRPISANIQKSGPKFGKENRLSDNDSDYDGLDIQEVSEEGANFAEFEKSFGQKIFNSRPTTATIFKKDTETELPYPELFDRSERTFAATYAKFGDLSYYTPLQRIGSYMDYSARLKKKHLMDIIQYLKTSKTAMKVEDEEASQDFLDSCLFIGVMQEEELKNQAMELSFAANQTKNVQQKGEEKEGYDPMNAKPEGQPSNDQVWSKALLKQVQLSVHRYHHYLESQDCIKNEVISKYKKEWMSHALDLLSDDLVKEHQNLLRDLFQEVFTSYTESMKKAILNYILRSPDERKRLHILVLPRPIPPSSDKICLSGGYSTSLYPGWHSRKVQAEQEVKLRLLTNNVVMSSLHSWWYDFRSVNLFQFENLKCFVSDGYSLDIDAFIAIQEAIREKAHSLMFNIWYRGVIMIIKKFKFLKHRGLLPNGKWTYSGYAEYEKQHELTTNDSNLEEDYSPILFDKPYSINNGLTHNQTYLKTLHGCHDMRGKTFVAGRQDGEFENEFYWREGFEFDSMIEDFAVDTGVEDLIDVRENSAYIAFVAMIGGYINYDEDGYEILAKEYKRELKYAAGNMINLQLRELVNKSIHRIRKLFEGFYTMEELVRDAQKRGEVKLDNSFVSDSDGSNIGKEVPQPDSSPSKSPKRKLPPGKVQRYQTFKPIVRKRVKLPHPAFMSYQHMFTPIFRICLQLDNNTIEFGHTDKDFIQKILTQVDRVICTFNDFAHPEFASLEFITKQRFEEEEEEEKRQKRLLFHTTKKANEYENVIFKGYDKDIYRKYIPTIRIKHSLKTSKDISGDENNIFAKKIIEKHLWVADTQEDSFKVIKSFISDQIQRHYKECQQIHQLFEVLQPLIRRDLEENIKQFCTGDHKMDEFQTLLLDLRDYQSLVDQLPHTVFFPMFEISTVQVKQILQDRISKLIYQVFRKFEVGVIERSTAICDRYHQIVKKLEMILKTPEDVLDMDKYKNNLLIEMSSLSDRMYENRKSIFFLIQMDFTMSEETMDLVRALHMWPSRLNKALDVADDRHRHERGAIEEKVIKNKDKFEVQIGGFEEDIKEILTFGDVYKFDQSYEKILQFNSQIEQYEEQMNTLSSQELMLFGFKSTYDSFFNLKKFFTPHYDMWTSVASFMSKKQEWNDTKLNSIDAEEVESMVKLSAKSIERLRKRFDDKLLASRVLQLFDKEVQDLNSWVPTIGVLCNKGLKDRHWKEIMIIAQNEFNYENITLDGIKLYPVRDHLMSLQEISERASKEFGLEKLMDKMMAEWADLHFEIGTFRDTGIPILKGQNVEEIQLLLDDHTIKAQMVRGNPNVKPMEDRAIGWEKLLLHIQECLEVWIKVQANYLYLEPVFGSEDIVKKLPGEAAEFLKVNKMWGELMSDLADDTKVLHLEKIPNLFEQLDRANSALDRIQKSLSDYLETKRQFFPRFYFLSNEDLLEILGESKKPLKVQRHLKKCFEGIDQLVFTERTEITGMVSREGEEMAFEQQIYPNEYKGNVEQWLAEVEIFMKQAVRLHLANSTDSYQKSDRLRWIQQWQGQIVLTVSQVMWTSQVQSCLSKASNQLSELKTYFKQCNEQLQDIVNMVRHDLDPLVRLTMGSLIVLDVHSKDVLEAIIEKGVTGINDFEWLSQMRYYYYPMEKHIDVKMINATVDMGYEYLGNQSRLVITPLTDRCYRTLMSALHLNLGGAPEGPAGTGKTESTKDLAKAVAVHCMVFNCAEGLNAKAMAKFFKGLASAGSWSCFDEFNRIELEVLSVVAQQILEIQKAKSLKKEVFFFDDADIVLKGSCNVFITMNPGYAGRSELPDNLKALFRPVAMMIPDYNMIAEISLYSFGFLESRNLAKKIVATYKLCSEQLSRQDHYDYGMRAVKAVLTAARNLKRKYPSESEDKLILMSINDVNLPKFLKHDIPLFQGITEDLFQGVSLKAQEYGTLGTCILQSIQKFKLKQVEPFVDKIIQLYEMINCRHGLMLVGPPFGAKTSAYRVLADAITQTCLQDENYGELPVKHFVMNPKSVTLNQLYGWFDPISHDFTDGILAQIFRNCAYKHVGKYRNWIVFDGPVDANWIENMNTVLDDNKKLCLLNGEVIMMNDNMNLIFETGDLSQASPATVSRCGMVYMQPESIGWQPILSCWIQTLPSVIDQNLIKHLEDLFEVLIPLSFSFLRKKCKTFVPVSEVELTHNLMKIYYVLIGKNQHFLDMCVNPKVKPEDLVNRLDMAFLFALIWSFGSVTDENGTKFFSQFVRKNLGDSFKVASRNNKTFKIDKLSQLPESGMQHVHNFFIDDYRWKSWKEVLERQDREMVLDPTLKFNEIVIPTTETLKYTFLLDLFVKNELPVLIIGPTGTGKTAYATKYLRNLSTENYQSTFLCFSAKTTANQTQDIIDAKLEKRGRKIYGPPFGKKCVVFVDDLNMPQLEKYGAQPPIELLRQWMDHKGWYDRKEKDKSFKELKDLLWVACMGPPSGGKNPVTQRYLRHFNIIAINNFDEQVLLRIYTKLMDWHIKNNGYDQEIERALKSSVAGAVDMYLAVSAELRPTPHKSHYLFNLRDLSRVIQGIQMLRKEEATDAKKIIRLWVHETCRVFYDRLTNDLDKQWFYERLFKSSREKVRDDLTQVFKGIIDETVTPMQSKEALKFNIFGDLMGDGISCHDRPYEEIHNPQNLIDKINSYLEDYNSISKKPMSLVIFQYASLHILRVCRVLRMPGGNSLLIGVGGSGRQSLTKLSSFICDYELFEIEITKSYTQDVWRDDMKVLLKQAGVEGKPYVFLLSDAQLKFSFILEDINNLLNTGEIPNLFPNDEKAQIVEKLRPLSKKEGRMELFNNGMNEQFLDYFTERVKANLHIVLAMSPIGDALRTRIRNFPSLVNCCTIDWFTAWPDEALEAVADKFLQEVDMSEYIRGQLIQMCKKVHKSVTELSSKYEQEEKRYNYVTPTSYLELIQLYKSLLTQQRDLIMGQKIGYERGIEKLKFTAEEVSKMQEDLNDKQPKLIQMTAETEELLAQIKKESDEVVEPKKRQIQEEEAIANEQAAQAQCIKIECDNELAKAMPLVKKAIEALNTIQAKDINEMKALGKPPGPIKKVMHAVCLMCQRKVEKTPKKESPKEFEENWWLTAQKFMSEKDFMQQILNFDKDHIPDLVIKKIRDGFINDPDFKPSRVQQASMAAKGLCLWVRALDEYDKVAKIVAPKRAAAKEAEQTYQKTIASLREKQEELREVVEVFEQLQQQLESAEMRKQRLQDDIEDCKKKLIRAEQLLGGLGGEKERWEQNTIDLAKKYENLIGDVLICASVISYLGAFTSTYRQQCLKYWQFGLSLANINVSPNFSLHACLGQPVVIRQWTLNGLPNDNFSVDNGIIVENSRRWPLLIDPQLQANKWIKANEASKGSQLKTVKLTDSGFVRDLETCIQLGIPVLIENVGEDLDPILEPLLLKQTFKNSGLLSIKLGENIVEYNEQFRLFITTKHRNPHYLPELSTKVTLLNFMITFEGLRDQLLNLVVQKENAALDDLRQKLVVQSYENKKQLKDIEDKILEVLRNSKGNILDDEVAIDVLNQSQTLSKEIKEKQQQSEEAEVRLQEAQKSYDPISFHASLLFFIISNLANLDVMYQYSLTWFINLFCGSIEHSEKNEDIEERIEILKKYFTSSLYKNVCRSLFEQHKLIFSFILTSKLLEASGELDPKLYSFLTSSQSGLENPLNQKNPCPEWLNNQTWNKLCDLSIQIERYATIPEKFKENEKSWKAFFDAPFPHQADLPDEYWEMSEFEKMLLIKILRPDKLVPAAKDFIIIKMGEQFVNPPPFDLELSYSDSTCKTPLIFVLPGADPQQALNIFAKSKKKFESMRTISLGQGQGAIAERAIEEASKQGFWVLLQNCHLYPSWMSKLEKIQESLETKTTKDLHPSFRLWLTSYPSDQFPILLLQNGIKMTNEPPKGLKANMVGSYSSYPIASAEFFSDHNAPQVLGRLLYGLCMFHAIIQERRTFGPLGWNIKYEFNMSDLTVSVMQLHQFTSDYRDVPFNAINYLTGECNYGGRVTDDRDRRVLKALLNDFYKEEVFDETFAPSGLRDYRFPNASLTHEGTLDFIHKLPLEEPPELFGFHPNANITKDINETEQLISSMVKVGEIEGLRNQSAQDQFQSTTEAAPMTQMRDKNEVLVENMAKDILKKLPRKFDIEQALEKYPTLRENSMNTVLVQEMQRFNGLTKVIRKTLSNLQLGLKGEIMMSEDLEKIYKSLLIGEIPELWMRYSYPSLKEVASYIKDLLLRLETLQHWFNNGPPNVFWLSGFFFTQSFLTAIMQNYARKYKIEIDTLTFEFDYLQADPTDYTNQIFNNDNIHHLKKPEDGAMISGLYLEGAKWDYESHQLAESDPFVLFVKVPIIWFKPTQIKKVTSYKFYECPLYKTVERRGTLSTTGHSTNFILSLKVPTDLDESHWVKRGVAMICQLSS